MPQPNEPDFQASKVVRSRALYFRERRAILRKTKGFQEKRLFQQGVEALRKTACEAFKGIGLGEMNGYTAAEVVKNLKLVN